MRTGRHLIEQDGVTHSPNCFPCKIKTVSIAPSALITQSPEAARAKTADPQLEKDRAAYKAMRRNGVQPKSIHGAAELQANANETFEITTGRIESDPSIRKRAAVAFAEMPKPSSDPIVREDG